jgi:hypothetical protein
MVITLNYWGYFPYAENTAIQRKMVGCFFPLPLLWNASFFGVLRLPVFDEEVVVVFSQAIARHSVKAQIDKIY